MGKFWDRGAPSVSLDGNLITYLLWHAGRQAIVVESGKGDIVWKWGAEPQKQTIVSEPIISPKGRWVAFFVEDGYSRIYAESPLPSPYWSPSASAKKQKKVFSFWLCEKKIFLKDLENNRSYKLLTPPTSPNFFPIGSPFLLSLDNFIILGRIRESEGGKFVELFFYRGKDFLYSTGKMVSFKNWEVLNARFQLLWSPSQRLIAVVPERWCWKEPEKISISIDRVFLVDPFNRKTRDFKLPPAH